MKVKSHQKIHQILAHKEVFLNHSFVKFFACIQKRNFFLLFKKKIEIGFCFAFKIFALLLIWHLTILLRQQNFLLLVFLRNP